MNTREDVKCVSIIYFTFVYGIDLCEKKIAFQVHESSPRLPSPRVRRLKNAHEILFDPKLALFWGKNQ